MPAKNIAGELALDRFELLPNATGMREILSPRAGFVSAIMAEDIGRASQMIGAGRTRKEDVIDPATLPGAPK